MGNATEVDVSEVEKEISPLLIEKEKIEKAYKLIRDYFVFTNKRFVLVDKQGLTGKKVDYHSIPYKNITHFSVETAGHFDMDCELKIWMKGSSAPVAKEFKKDTKILDIQKTLASYVLHASE